MTTQVFNKDTGAMETRLTDGTVLNNQTFTITEVSDKKKLTHKNLIRLRLREWSMTQLLDRRAPKHLFLIQCRTALHKVNL